MTIVKRETLGRPLTWTELDNNFSEVEELIGQANVAVETATAQASSSQAAANQATSAANNAQTSADSAFQSAANAELAAINAVNGLKTELVAPTGSTLVSNRVNLSQAVTRSIQSRSRDYVSIIDFGADPTGATPSGQAIQNALDAVSGKIVGSMRGGRLHSPSGNYIVDVELTYTWRATAGLNDYDVRRLTLSGDGSGNTFWTFTGNSTGICLSIDGGDVSVADPHLRIGIQGMRIQRQLDKPFQARGVYFRNIAIMNLYDFDVHWFNEGIVFHDVIQVSMIHCQLGANATGVILGRLSWTQPNVYVLQHVMFGGCRDNGILIDNGANILIDTCSFEGIGNNNSAAADLHAIRYVGAPLEGGIGLNVRNCYFENTNVFSDINIASNATLPGVHIIEGNSFQRTSTVSYCKTHINLSPNNSAGYMQVHLKGNRFKFAGGYNGNAGDTSVSVQTQWANVIDSGNLYETAQPPQYAGFTVRGYRDHVFASARVNASGAIVAESNVASVVNPTAGVFDVNFRKSASDDLVIPVATLIGATGSIIVNAADKNSVRVTVYNAAGTPVNGVAFSVMVVGVYGK